MITFSFAKELICFASGALPFILLPRNVIFKQQDDSDSIERNISTRATQYTTKFAQYIEQEQWTDSMLIEIANLGTEYFKEVRILCQRINQDILNVQNVRDTHLPSVKKFVERRLMENHFSKLDERAKIKGHFSYDENPECINFESV